MKLTTHEIRKLAKEIIAGNPSGIRNRDLVHAISEPNPETPVNTIHGSIWDLHLKFPSQIAKPSRGVFAPATGVTTEQTSKIEQGETEAKHAANEVDFYGPFADCLKNDLDEATDAIALGGGALGRKWGTPDVVGVFRPLASNLIKFPLEVISAEVKLDPQQPVVAFGQAIAYRLFSAKTYIAMPRSMGAEDQSRLEALCMLFGIGLVLFDENEPRNPDFAIRVRAQRFTPDMFYVNEFAERLKESDPENFERLFR